ncbi:MAG: ABC transporter ATP-binding protein [Actinomycetaceae bacterium]|nr:ABC transporter ATP-binding protein [Actinomycetaceae bacterium]
MDENRNVIEVKNIRKEYSLRKKERKEKDQRIKVALQNINFSVRQGETYGLLGANGAGKTTLLRIISGLISPTKGDVLIHGIKSSSKDLRSHIGFCTSELKMDDLLTPEYLCDFFASLHHVEETKKRKHREKLFERFGINEYAHTKIGDLSTGMKQKVSLAVALAHDPQIVILDEPTNGLDIFVNRTVQDFIKELQEEGKTILVSSHIFSFIEQVCHRVGVIVEGNISAEYSLPLMGESLEAKFFELHEGREV